VCMPIYMCDLSSGCIHNTYHHHTHTYMYVCMLLQPRTNDYCMCCAVCGCCVVCMCITRVCVCECIVRLYVLALQSCVCGVCMCVVWQHCVRGGVVCSVCVVRRVVVTVTLSLCVCVCVWTQDGETPLHLAAGSGHPDVSRMLLDAGADIQAKDNVSTFSVCVRCVVQSAVYVV